MGSESHFGKFNLRSRLGVGGMAEVYLAEMVGPEGFVKPVALKRILSHICDDDDFIASLISEARLGGQLNHPNIVQTLELGREGEQYYIAMEYVDGVTLARLIRHRRALGVPLPLPGALEIARQICEGLTYAHLARDSAGKPLNMIHRDLKPDNILLSKYGTVKITDFGVAKAESNLRPTLSSDTVKGTVAYMSPEQARGEILTPCSDLYSVGAILFELLTLERLYPNVKGLLGVQEVAMGVVAHRLDKLEVYPRGVRTLAQQLLREKPVERFGSATEVRSELMRLAGTLPVSFIDLSTIIRDVMETKLDSRLEPPSPRAPTEAEHPPSLPPTLSRWSALLSVQNQEAAGGRPIERLSAASAIEPEGKPDEALEGRPIEQLQAASASVAEGEPDDAEVGGSIERLEASPDDGHKGESESVEMGKPAESQEAISASAAEGEPILEEGDPKKPAEESPPIPRYFASEESIERNESDAGPSQQLGALNPEEASTPPLQEAETVLHARAATAEKPASLEPIPDGSDREAAVTPTIEMPPAMIRAYETQVEGTNDAFARFSVGEIPEAPVFPDSTPETVDKEPQAASTDVAKAELARASHDKKASHDDEIAKPAIATSDEEEAESEEEAEPEEEYSGEFTLDILDLFLAEDALDEDESPDKEPQVESLLGSSFESHWGDSTEEPSEAISRISEILLLEETLERRLFGQKEEPSAAILEDCPNEEEVEAFPTGPTSSELSKMEPPPPPGPSFTESTWSAPDPPAPEAPPPTGSAWSEAEPPNPSSPSLGDSNEKEAESPHPPGPSADGPILHGVRIPTAMHGNRHRLTRDRDLPFHLDPPPFSVMTTIVPPPQRDSSLQGKALEANGGLLSRLTKRLPFLSSSRHRKGGRVVLGLLVLAAMCLLFWGVARHLLV